LVRRIIEVFPIRIKVAAALFGTHKKDIPKEARKWSA
jgi:hypothetical protein